VRKTFDIKKIEDLTDKGWWPCGRRGAWGFGLLVRGQLCLPPNLMSRALAALRHRWRV